MKHPSDEIFELFVFAPDKLAEADRASLEAHVGECRLCAEHLEGTRRFYQELEQRLEEAPSDAHKTLAERLLKKRSRSLLPFLGVERSRKDRPVGAAFEILEHSESTLPQRLVRYMRAHPARVAASLTAVVAVVLFALPVLRPPEDINPAYALVKNQILTVHSSDTKLLWTKHATGMRDDSVYYSHSQRSDDMLSELQTVYVLDIDGDGRNEILVTGYFDATRVRQEFSADTVYCFDHDGTLRWTYGMGAGIAFGSFDLSDNPAWQVRRLITVQNTREERVQLFAVGQTLPSWPAKLVELDPRTGNELQTYWHPGSIVGIVGGDLEQDGKQELIVIGINNAYQAAVLLVFDPLVVRGTGPTTPEWRPRGLSGGTEKYYLLLPRTSYGMKFGRSPYNIPSNVMISERGALTIQTLETIEPEWEGGIVYSFDAKLYPTYAVGNDLFVRNYERAHEKGMFHEKLTPAYYENLKRSIRYWDGEKFVKEPKMNKGYRNIQNLP